jgi:hypothetical protein
MSWVRFQVAAPALKYLASVVTTVTVTLNSNTGRKFIKLYRTILFQGRLRSCCPESSSARGFPSGFDRPQLVEQSIPTTHESHKIQSSTMNEQQFITDKAATIALGLQQQIMLLQTRSSCHIRAGKQRQSLWTCNPRHQARSQGGSESTRLRKHKHLNRKLQALSNYYKLRFTTTDATVGINIAFVQVAPITGTR